MPGPCLRSSTSGDGHDRGAGGPGRESAVLGALPVRAQISRAWLMTGTREPDSWRAIAELPLAGG